MIGAESGGVNWFRKLYAMAFVRFEVDDLDLLQAVFPFRQDGMILEQIDSVDLDGGPVSYELFPVLFRWIGQGRGDDAKVLRAFIGANIEEIAAMFYVVFVIGLARDNRLPDGVGIVGGDKAKLGRSLAERPDHDYGFVSGTLNADVKQLVLLVIDQFVLIRAQHVAKQFVVSLSHRILSYVEQSSIVGSPGHVIDAFDLFGQHFAGAQVLDLQRVL